MTVAICSSRSMGTCRTTLKAEASSISAITAPRLVVPSTSSFRPSGGTYGQCRRQAQDRMMTRFRSHTNMQTQQSTRKPQVTLSQRSLPAASCYTSVLLCCPPLCALKQPDAALRLCKNACGGGG